jgi:hypothetical protein
MPFLQSQDSRRHSTTSNICHRISYKTDAVMAMYTFWLRSQSTRGTPRHQPGYGVDQPTKLKFTCCWSPYLLQRKLRQVLCSLEICLGLTFCSHCILPCIPNSAPILKIPAASLLSCMGSLVITERHIWLQHLGWCELVLCSLICIIKSVWLDMLNAVQDCLQAGAVSIRPSDKIIWFEKHVILCVNFLDDHHNHCPL